MSRVRKIFAWIAGAGFTMLALVILLALAAPRILNLNKTRQYIAAQVKKTLGCELDYETMELSFFPSPAATIRRGHLSIDGRFEARWQELKVRPDLLSLLTGEVRIAELMLKSPDVYYRMPPPSSESSGTSPQSLSVAFATSEHPLKVRLSDGTVHILSDGRDTLTCRQVNGRLDILESRVLAELSSTADSWQGLNVAAEFNPSTGRGSAYLQVRQLHPEMLAALAFPKWAGRLGNSILNGKVRLTVNSGSDWTAEISGALPRLTLLDEKGLIPLQVGELTGSVHHTALGTSIKLEKLALTEPRVTFSGHFTEQAQTPRLQMAITASSLDLDTVRPMALRLFSEHHVALEIFDVLRGGEVETVTFESQGDNGHEIGDHHHFLITGRLSHGVVHVPDVDLDLQEVVGDVAVKDGILTGSDLSGRMGRSSADSGHLVLDLAEDTGPFSLDVRLNADLRGLPQLLARLVKDPGFEHEMGLIKHLEGRAKGRLLIGDRRNSVQVEVFAKDIEATSSYHRIPYPIQVDGGSFHYRGDRIELDCVRAIAGSTVLNNIMAKIDWSGTMQLQCATSNAQVDLPEIFSWLDSYPSIKAKLSSFHEFHGKAVLSTLEMKGPAEHPKKWRFRLAGKLQQFSMAASFLPATLATELGHVSADPETLSFRADKAHLLDTAGTVSGSIKNYLEGVSAIEIHFKGKVDPKAYQWCDKQFKIPKELTLQPPFYLSKSLFAWERDGKVSVAASAAFPDGPEVGIVLNDSARALRIERLVVNDTNARAEMSLTRNAAAWDIRFKGQLNGRSLDRVLARNNFLSGSIQGDFSMKLPSKHWAGFQAKGTLKGTGVNKPWSLTWQRRWPFTLESVQLSADQGRISIASATLDWGGSTLKVKGVFRFLTRLCTYDLDVQAAELSSEQLLELAKPDRKSVKSTASKSTGSSSADQPTVRGSIQLHVDRFRYHSFVVEPFSASFAIHDDSVDFRIGEARTCGVDTPGKGTIASDRFSLNLDAKARRQQLSPSMSCFFNKPNMIDGTFDLDAVLAASGKPADFWKALGGSVKFVAQNGRIYRFTLLSKIFALLNLTEILRGKTPDLVKDGFAYNTFTLSGPIKEGKLYMDQGYLDGASMTIAWQGECDLEKKTIDMTVLVAPLKTVDSIIKHIPVVNKLLKGSLISIPIKVSGPLEDPVVVPLSPTAVGEGILGFIERTLKLPLTIIQPLIPQSQ